jgi:hypothetical protein
VTTRCLFATSVEILPQRAKVEVVVLPEAQNSRGALRGAEAILLRDVGLNLLMTLQVMTQMVKWPLGTSGPQ